MLCLFLNYLSATRERRGFLLVYNIIFNLAPMLSVNVPRMGARSVRDGRVYIVRGASGDDCGKNCGTVSGFDAPSAVRLV